MAQASKLELLLLAKDAMSPSIQRLLNLLKKTEKEGKTSTNVVDKLTKKLSSAPKTDGLKKTVAELNKTATAAEKAARAEDNLNNARKGGNGGKARATVADNTKQEASDKTRLASADEKAAKAEEKLKSARKGALAASGKINQEAAGKTKLAGATQKAADAEEKLNAARKRNPSGDAKTKQETADKTKLAGADEKAAAAENKLNNARKRSNSGDAKTKQEIGDKNRLASANDKAAASEEKLNRARKRGVRGGGGGSSSGRRFPNNPPRGGNGSFQEDLVQGGTGLALTATATKGFGAAMSQQEAFTDIYNSFYRSSLSAAEMNGQMEKAEEISIRLGNKLKGNTSDFANMLSTMKQNGMEATTILDGAGEAAAYLAIANREDYSDVGKNYAQFGQLFEVKGKEDNLKIADLMSRAKGKGVSSDDLITASKYFGGRTAKTMGLTGAKGAEETLRFMAFIKQNTALEASSVGTGSSAFFRAFINDEGKKKPAVPEMEKKLGIKLDLFDDKGQFKGLENAVAKFAQMKGKLSDKESLQFGQDLAGDEGAAVLGAMINAGSTYQKANKDLDEMASMMTKAEKESGNLSNKLESLKGSLENLGAESFKPMLEPLGSVTDKTNEWVGSLTEAAKAQPVFSATTAGVLTLVGALLTLKGGSGILSGLASRFGGVTEAVAAGTTNVGGLSKSLTSLPTMLKIGLTVMIAAEAWEQIQKMRSTVDDWKKMNDGMDKNGATAYKAQQQEDEVYKEKNKGTENKTWAKDGMLGVKQAPDYKNRAKDALSALQQGNKEFSKALDPKQMGWYESFARFTGALVTGKQQEPFYRSGVGKDTPEQRAEFGNLVKKYNQMRVPSMFRTGTDRAIKETVGAESIKARVPMLADPNTMTAFRRDSLPTLNLNNEMMQHVNNMLQRAFPESFAQSQQQMSQSSGLLNQSFLNLMPPVTTATDQILGLSNNSTTATNAVGNLANATENAASRISNVQITPPTFAPISVPFYTPTAAAAAVPSPSPLSNLIPRAKGGSVKAGRAYKFNEIGQEIFIPHVSGSVVANDILRKRKPDNDNTGNSFVSPTNNASTSIMRMIDAANNATNRLKAVGQNFPAPNIHIFAGNKDALPKINPAKKENSFNISNSFTNSNYFSNSITKTENTAKNNPHRINNPQVPQRTTNVQVLPQLSAENRLPVSAPAAPTLPARNLPAPQINGGNNDAFRRTNPVGKENISNISNISNSFTNSNYFSNSITKTIGAPVGRIPPAERRQPISVTVSPSLIGNRLNRPAEIGQPEQIGGDNVSNSILRNSHTAVVSSAPNINLTVQITVDGSEDPRAAALEIKRELAFLVSEMKEELNPRRVARKVAYEAERDAERT
jgi:TP901 family phage tail tape measure protein